MAIRAPDFQIPVAPARLSRGKPVEESIPTRPVNSEIGGGPKRPAAETIGALAPESNSVHYDPMRLVELSLRLNGIIFRSQIRRLTRLDMEMADRWTLARIREGHPDWSEERVMAHFNSLEHISVRAVDEWSRRFAFD